MAMINWLQLFRVQQWYKSLVIFLALFYTYNLFNIPLLVKTILGYASFCMVSSAYYILNDLHDARADRAHPEKKRRPIASGELSKSMAIFISIVLFACSTVLAFLLNPIFGLFPVMLYILNILHTYWLRNVVFVDVHVISLNFLLKAVAGAVLIKVPASVWLIASVYFIALFLAVSKRLGELNILGENASKFKVVYNVYTSELLERMILVLVSVLLFTYIMYSFTAHERPYMMLTIPFASFMVFRYLYFISINHEAVRKVEFLFLDRQMVSCFIL